jgi:hypothetical protein
MVLAIISAVAAAGLLSVGILGGVVDGVVDDVFEGFGRSEKLMVSNGRDTK